MIALLAQTVLLVEAADTPAGIEHLLLTGEEGVALGTNFHTDILLGGAGRIDSTASAADGGLLIIRMDLMIRMANYTHPILFYFSFAKSAYTIMRDYMAQLVSAHHYR